MAWIRLSDDYTDHPKFTALCDGAFRLWHEGMAYCRKHQTDGMIPFHALRGFRAYSPKRTRELQTPWRAGESPLWELIESFGVKVHDYLDWNLSKEEESSERASTAARVRKFRARCNGVTNTEVTEPVPAVTNGNVQGRSRSGSGSSLEKGFGEKPASPPLAAAVGKPRPLPEYPRLSVFPFQVQRFVDSLGDHVADFDVSRWLSELNDNTRLVLPSKPDERRKWLEDAFDYELKRRGWLGAASTETRNERVRELLKQRDAR